MKTKDVVGCRLPNHEEREVVRERLCISKDELTSDVEVRSCDETVENV